MISIRIFFLAEDVYQSSLNIDHVDCDRFVGDNVDNDGGVGTCGVSEAKGG